MTQTKTKTMGILIGLLIVASFAFIAHSTKANEGIVVKTGTYYGMCLGYCTTEYVITEKGITIVQKSWHWEKDEFPDKIYENGITKEQWEKIISLIDWESFNSLPDVIGAPDSGDEGGEWIEITMNGKTKRVVFSEGSDVPEIQNLVNELREFRGLNYPTEIIL